MGPIGHGLKGPRPPTPRAHAGSAEGRVAGTAWMAVGPGQGAARRLSPRSAAALVAAAARGGMHRGLRAACDGGSGGAGDRRRGAAFRRRQRAAAAG